MSGQPHTPSSLLRGRESPVPLCRRHGGPHSRSGRFGEGKISSTRQDVNPALSSPWTSSCVRFSVYSEHHVPYSKKLVE